MRVGKEREKFTGIWMVVIRDRIFGRSYYGADRSWYTNFLEGNEGEIKCKKEIISVKGVKPADIDTITAAINKPTGKISGEELQ